MIPRTVHVDQALIARLRVLARSAQSHRPGRWESVGSAVVSPGGDHGDQAFYGGELVGESMPHAVSLHIAACDPSVVLALCDAIERLSWQTTERLLLDVRAK